ncbi:AraC family transcriptional regulator [Streptomyces armeniacus]|uniref:AraC family transcriptional regulator n=1 Tax=Streptomyces armeniacus TaxID=83291 RepID=A0A345XT12_9ACTN|nr:helix-turn-helix transcriptional regulator [Streptomyces armeniacus]AXK34778.1 AraC family transcriptional regulator [Streptomyces armeniacus]
MYGERPSRLGGGAVLWSRTGSAGTGSGAGGTRVLPDGCMDLIWYDAAPGGGDGGFLVAGPDTRAHLTPVFAGIRLTGLRFAPGTGPAVFGIPAHELRDQRVPLDALWPGREVRRLAERVAEAADTGVALEAAAGPRAPADPLSRLVPEALRRGRSVADVAAAAGLSERQLHRRALDVFGYGPKTLARVLRMRHALRLAREGQSFASVAATARYADQAHLSREIKSLAGVPLTRLIVRAPGRAEPPTPARARDVRARPAA